MSGIIWIPLSSVFQSLDYVGTGGEDVGVFILIVVLTMPI
jgi:hypothetical protein